MLSEQALEAKKARADAGDHDHCWHSYEMLLTSPPISKDICCWCGQYNDVRNAWPTQDHGTFMPGSIQVRRA